MLSTRYLYWFSALGLAPEEPRVHARDRGRATLLQRCTAVGGKGTIESVSERGDRLAGFYVSPSIRHHGKRHRVTVTVMAEPRRVSAQARYAGA